MSKNQDFQVIDRVTSWNYIFIYWTWTFTVHIKITQYEVAKEEYPYNLVKCKLQVKKRISIFNFIFISQLQSSFALNMRSKNGYIKKALMRHKKIVQIPSNQSWLSWVWYFHKNSSTNFFTSLSSRSKTLKCTIKVLLRILMLGEKRGWCEMYRFQNAFISS